MDRAFGIAFTALSEAELTNEIARRPVPRGAGPRMVLTANVDHIVQLARNEAFRDCYRRAWVVTADGMPVYLYARWKGDRLPERLTGADLFRALMPALSPAAHRCFFLAGSVGTAEKLLAYLRKRGFASEALAYDVPPFGFERDEAYSEALARRIARHRPTHLFLGLGSPKSELWADRWRERLGDCYVLSVGAAFDFFVGARRRAPAWMQRSGFEWAWRFAQEPRRLFKRYWIDSAVFLAAIAHDRHAPLISHHESRRG